MYKTERAKELTTLLASIPGTLDSPAIRNMLTAAMQSRFRIGQVEFVPHETEACTLVRTSQPLIGLERLEAFWYACGFLDGRVAE